jgi:hypothetical protein
MKKIFYLLAFVTAINNIATAQTYKDVAPIFIANCVSCHNVGAANFSLATYSDVVVNANSIAADVQSGRMPPWPPDANYRHFANEKLLSAADKTKLIYWINAGTIAGDTTLAPPVPAYRNVQLYGTPDVVIKLPKYISTATAIDKYVCLTAPSGITQDRYIRAFEYVPGNAAMIHHAVLTIDTTGTAVDDTSGTCYNFQGQIGIGDFAPGMGPTVFPGVAPTKLGFRLKANATMCFQLHVPEGTAGLQDSSELHLYFYPINEPNIRPMFFETVLQNWNFSIPANGTKTVKAFYPTSGTLPIDVSLYSSFVHSHNTCTSIINFAFKAPDTIPLIKVPHWDFHWQKQYTYPKMVKIPVGYRLFASHFYDNTSNNPLTPNNNLPVYPGTNTNDEMLFDSYIYTLYQAGDENIDIAAILANDPLFTPTSISQPTLTFKQVSTYPNPFSNQIHISYTLLAAQFVQISIFDTKGQLVKKLCNTIQASGKHQISWDGTNQEGTKLNSGMYIYKLQAGKSVQSGAIMLN